jgi:hypothetical protein
VLLATGVGLAVLGVGVVLLLTGRVVPPPPPPTDVVPPAAAARGFGGPDTQVDDPTSEGRITARARHALDQVDAVFDEWPWSTTCWDEHAWNPGSDHPQGRACDWTVGRIGDRPAAADRDTGWQLALWLQENADELGVRYVIWDGHIWSARRAFQGWRAYDGGGVYDPSDVTGGHYDHVHLSVTN